MPLTIISLTAIPLIALGLILHTYMSSTLIRISEHRVKEVSELLSNGLEELIEAQKMQVRIAAQIHEMEELLKAIDKGEDSSEIERLREKTNHILWKQLNESGDLQSISLISADGKVIASSHQNAINIDVKDREYFKEAKQRNIAVSNMLISRLHEEKVVDIAASVMDSENNVIGVITNTINVSYFKRHVDSVKIENTGYAYIVDSDGVMVSHPEVNKIGSLVENSEIKRVIDQINHNEEVKSGEGTYNYREKERYMAYHSIGDLNWLLVVAQDKSEMKIIAFVVLTIITSATVIILILSLIAGERFSKSITTPIAELTSIMDKAASGDLTVESTLNSEDEFGQLSKDFNIMLSKLNLSYEELTALYEQLGAAEEELRAQYEELQSNEEALRNSEEKYRLAIEGANDVIWEWNLQTKEFFASEKWRELTGFSLPRKANIKQLSIIVVDEDFEKVTMDLKEHLEGKTDFYKSEFRIKSKDGGYKWVLNRGTVLRDSENKPIKIAGSLTDITERKKIEQKIEFMAYYDTLTGLPNRTYFMTVLEKELAKARDDNGTGIVLFIDVDNFKNTNDTLGHDYGDMLLELIARRLKVNSSEDYTVCRFGGDEFIILKSGINSEDDTAAFAEKILKVFHETFEINEKRIDATVSIGIAIYPKDGVEGSKILKNADTAMYRSKGAGKNKYTFFDEAMYDGLEKKNKINSILKQAIKNNEFQLHYQPLINIRTGSISGFEALLRLNSKELGFISPSEFIPIAEESDLINEIGHWCLSAACLKGRDWRDKGFDCGTIAVNISSVQFKQENFLQSIKDVLVSTGLKPEYLCIEITESVLMENLEDNVKVLDELKSIGVKISLDDFGTGYSSLNYLRKMPIDTLKMDKAFIDGICLSPKEEAIADGIIQMAHKMALEVVAEGVEDKKQLMVLKEKNCDKIQGYLISRPLTEEKAFELLIEYTRNAEKMVSATLDF
jgi:diguanylate cyclase (GGDEF)-like protein/PAS domain S-box-containing protein